MAQSPTEPKLKAALPAIKGRHGLSELKVVVESRKKATERVHVVGAASPGRKSRSSDIPTGTRWKFAIPDGPLRALEGLGFPRLDREGEQERHPETDAPLPDRVVHGAARHVDVPEEFRDDPDEYLRRRIEGPAPAGHGGTVRDAGRFLDEEAWEDSLRRAVVGNQDRLAKAFLDENGQPRPSGVSETIQARVTGRIGVAYTLAPQTYPHAPRRAERVPESLVGVEAIMILSHVDQDTGTIYVVPETAYPIRTGRG